jgi:hypothetical protein
VAVFGPKAKRYAGSVERIVLVTFKLGTFAVRQPPKVNDLHPHIQPNRLTATIVPSRRC